MDSKLIMLQSVRKVSLDNVIQASQSNCVKDEKITSPKAQREELEGSWTALGLSTVPLSPPCIKSISTVLRNDTTIWHNPIVFKSGKKRVQFKVDPRDPTRVSCRVHPSTLKLNQDEARFIWYKGSDIKEMRREAVNEAILARASASSYLQHFQELYEACEHNLSVTALPHHLSQTVAASEYRGLETLTFVELLRLKQRIAVNDILATQECYIGLCTPDQMSRELYNVSTSLSERSRRLAFIIGIGDANIAMQLVSPKERESAQLDKQRSDRTLRLESTSSEEVISAPFEI